MRQGLPPVEALGEEYRQPRNVLPSLGKMVLDQVAPGTPEQAVAEADARLEHNYKTGLY